MRYPIQYPKKGRKIYPFEQYDRPDGIDEFSFLDNIDCEEAERLKHVMSSCEEDEWEEFEKDEWLMFYKDMGKKKYSE